MRDLTTEQNYALTHAQRFAKLDAKQSRNLVNDLLKIEELNDFHACKLTDIMPKYTDEVRTIFAKERFILEDDTIKKIIDTIEKYR